MTPGALVVDKPQGPTSHDVVAEARRALGERRIGHTGTLDPLATGVLPLVLGAATRLSQFLTGATKGYEATVRLGAATDTYDAAGRRVRVSPTWCVEGIGDDAIAGALAAFRGAYEQTPPPYSAKKVGGVRSYDLARLQREVPTTPVPVTVHALDLLEREGTMLRLRVEASAGFYVRALAHELGERLGCGAHLEALRRYRSGAFTLEDAVELDVLRRDPTACIARILPIDRLLPELPVIELSGRGTQKARHGNALGPSDARPRDGAIPPVGGLSRLFSDEGHFVALARTSSGGALQPVVVLG